MATDRTAREAAALRANLLKRKAQVRAREQEREREAVEKEQEKDERLIVPETSDE